MNAQVMTDEEFARFIGPHPLRVGDKVRRAKAKYIFIRRDGDGYWAGTSPGTVVEVDDVGFIVRWDNTGVRRYFRHCDEGRLWARVPHGPETLLSPSPWVPPRRRLGCCADRKYAGASHSCTEHTCMHLPVIGQTCADCRHVGRCTKMFGQDATDTYCQFFPRRFSPRAESEVRS